MEQNGNRPLAGLRALSERALLRVDGCSDVALSVALLEAFREFCEQSEVWRETRKLEVRSEELEVAGCDLTRHSELDARHFFCVPAGCHVKNVFFVRSGGRVLHERDWRFTECSCGCGYVEVSGSHHCLDVHFSVVPDDGFEDVPQFMVDRWGGVIRSGALFRLFAMDGKPWSDATQARVEMDKWNAGVNEAAHDGIMTGEGLCRF